MTQENLKERLIDILKNYTKEMSVWETATEESSIIGHLGIISAKFVSIILDIEDEFGIVINDATMNRIIYIKDAIEVIEELSLKK